MPRTRARVDRETIIDNANRSIAHLAKSGTKEDRDKRNAIISFTSSLLIEGNSYKGFGYLVHPSCGAENLTYENGIYLTPKRTQWVWDDSRVFFF